MPDIEFIREYALKKKDVTEEFPFDFVTLVFKVKGKIFILLSLDDNPVELNLKCDPELALDFRERFESVRPGYHMNKKHWNTVVLDGSIPTKEILKMIDHSYDLVVQGLPKGKKVIKKRTPRKK
jgi:predicted DNA-binding protein (MmcQ/YjbR family)